MKAAVTFADQPRDQFAVAHIAFDQCCFGIDVFAPAAAQIVKNGDAMPIRNEAIDQMRADKSCAAGNDKRAQAESFSLARFQSSSFSMTALTKSARRFW